MHKQISAESVYQIFYRKTNEVSGRVVRNIKNWDAIKSRQAEDWIFFEKFAAMCNRSNTIRPDAFIECLAKHFGGWFHPKHLTSPKAIKFYKVTMNERDNPTSVDDFVSVFVQTLKFLKTWCKENNINSFNDYLTLCQDTYPPALRHLQDGSITRYTLAAIPFAVDVINKWPSDTKNTDEIKAFLTNANTLKMKLHSVEKLKPILSNLPNIIFKVDDK